MLLLVLVGGDVFLHRIRQLLAGLLELLNSLAQASTELWKTGRPKKDKKGDANEKQMPRSEIHDISGRMRVSEVKA
jgi:hypothetical protein